MLNFFGSLGRTMKGTVVVTVHGLRTSAHVRGYVEVVVDGGHPKSMTTSVEHGSSPVWNETFVFEVETASHERPKLRLYLKDNRFVVGRYIAQTQLEYDDETQFPSGQTVLVRNQPLEPMSRVHHVIPRPSFCGELDVDVTVTWH